jgi:2-polyprenyl-3-methyl-5-hydroxy-6-metoxy-1,4-benzoquinol methylase
MPKAGRIMIEPKSIKNEYQVHEQWANDTDVNKIDVAKINQAKTSPELRFIHSQLGDIKNLKILDVGSGLGEAAVYFAIRGADVTCLDLSPTMLKLSQQLAQRHQVTIKTIAKPAHELSELNSDYLECFDIIYAGNFLHHINIQQDVPVLIKLLKPDGRFVSWDPIAYNPIINIYRKIAQQVRTLDEHPLTKSDITFITRQFNQQTVRYFWLISLFVFIWMVFFQGKNPNKVRLWKQVIEDEEKLNWIYIPLKRIDDYLLNKFNFLNWLCWNVVIIGKNKKARQSQ